MATMSIKNLVIKTYKKILLIMNIEAQKELRLKVFQSPPLSSPMSSLSSEQNSGHDAKTNDEIFELFRVIVGLFFVDCVLLLQVRAVIKGRVQGVFYRDWTVENAKELGLKGWVRNRRDGTVEALFSGSPEKVQEMEQRCRRGPPSAIVTGLDVFPCDDDPGTGEMAESDRPLAQVELFKTGLKRKYSSGEAMSRIKEKKTKATSNTTISEA
ncbi:Acylphosphatase [Capsicum annuum]|nr:Acylphosphatase [Capsicum annuum]